jgi:DNA-binding response OmpR family regulator
MSDPLAILVIDSHDISRIQTLDALRADGHRVHAIASGDELADQGRLIAPDLYLLRLPGADGRPLIARLRRSAPVVGIIALGGATLVERLATYDAGADLALRHVPEHEELSRLVAALGRRLQRRPGPGARPRNITLDPGRLTLSGPATSLPLSASEARLLDAFAKAPEQLLERWQVATNLGMDTKALSESSLEVRVANLRRKMLKVGGGETAPNPLRAVRGVGYKLCVPVNLC